jgi:integral membrane protein
VTADTLEEARRLRGALRRYQVMAVVVGTMLLLLVVVAIPLQYGAGHPGMADIVAPLHGFCYIAYLLTVADLARRAKLRIRELLAMVGAGFLPGLAFVIERRISAKFRPSSA